MDPYHVFGCHSKCRLEYCKRKELGERDWTNDPEFKEMFTEVLLKADKMARNASRLVSNETTNMCENFFSVGNKVSGGKRRNVYQRGEYQWRTIAAALSITRGATWSQGVFRRMNDGRSPG